MTIAILTRREVAELAGSSKRLLDKAIHQHVLPVRRVTARGGIRTPAQLLPSYAVAYAAIMTKLDLNLTKAHKIEAAGTADTLAACGD